MAKKYFIFYPQAQNILYWQANLTGLQRVEQSFIAPVHRQCSKQSRIQFNLNFLLVQVIFALSLTFKTLAFLPIWQFRCLSNWTATTTPPSSGAQAGTSSTCRRALPTSSTEDFFRQKSFFNPDKNLFILSESIVNYN